MEIYQKLESALEHNDINEFQLIFNDVENDKFKNEFSWDLALLFINYLKKYSDEKKIPNSEVILHSTKKLCQNYGNPKELYLVFLENSEFFLKDLNIMSLVDITETLLLKSTSKFVSNSIDNFLNLLEKFFQIEINLKHDHLIKILERILFFIRELVEKFFENSTDLFKNLINKFLIDRFHEPFIKLQSRDIENYFLSPDYESIFESNVSLVKILNKNIFKLITDSVMDQNKVDKLGLSLFISYLYFKQSKVINDYLSFPKIYHHFYIYEQIIPIINSLLYDLNNDILLKNGLATIKFLIEKFESKTWNENLLEIGIIIELFESLFRISIHANSENVRKLSNQILKIKFTIFDRKARFEFIKYFYNFYSKGSKSTETMNNYVLSYLFYLLKEEVNESLNLNEDFYTKTSPHLKSIFNLIFSRNKIDFSKESTQIISILNLVRLILLKDKVDKTGIFSQFKPVVLEYLKQIELNAEQSKLSYQNELRQLEKNTDKKHDSSKSITINEISYDEPTKDEQIKAIEYSLQTIHLIQSLIIRIEELFDEFAKK
ncbi:unnamed protein product [Brachionus calyciflorus]|uniref:Glomulin n=1 Tax=Brachionus calyciflorus TaxID=104777 RepID=A0A813LY02_9BILA|nr:unnamed protein product [Brachionus calyciflorus]